MGSECRACNPHHPASQLLLAQIFSRLWLSLCQQHLPEDFPEIVDLPATVSRNAWLFWMELGETDQGSLGTRESSCWRHARQSWPRPRKRVALVRRSWTRQMMLKRQIISTQPHRRAFAHPVSELEARQHHQLSQHEILGVHPDFPPQG